MPLGPLFWSLGCGAPVPPVVTADPLGVEVWQAEGVDRVDVLDAWGAPVLTHRLPSPATEVGLPVRWPEDGTYTVRISGPGGSWDVPVAVDSPQVPFVVRIEAPVGQAGVVVRDGDAIDVPLVDARPAQVAVTLTALESGPALVDVAGEQTRRILRPGERLTAMASVSRTGPLVARLGDSWVQSQLRAVPISSVELGEQLRILGVVFPADRHGDADMARPSDRVSLSAGWWVSVLQSTRFGFRTWDPHTPWAWQAVRVGNAGDQPINLVVRARVDRDGAPDAVFAPRMRQGTGTDDAVSVLLRVPAQSEATAVLPVFVDERRLLGEDRPHVRQRWVEVLPVGGPAPVARWEAPLFVRRGSTVASLGLVAAVAAAVAGMALLAARGRRWLAQSRTSDLMTIAMFGALASGKALAARLSGGDYYRAFSP